jgi:HPt (histidine-containing phosphotransfer) domain-containing protein
MNHSTDSEMLYDLSYLNQIFQGNDAMINQIITLFIHQVPTFVQQMNVAVGENRLDDLHPLAHKAKSSVAMLGMKEIEYLFLQVEFCSKNKKTPERIPGLVNQLEKLIEKASDQLGKELSRGSSAA